MGKLAGKVAIVTGASKGIGAGIAKGLAAEGASVVVNYASSKEGADRVVSEITKKGGRLLPVRGRDDAAQHLRELQKADFLAARDIENLRRRRRSSRPEDLPARYRVTWTKSMVWLPSP